MLTLTHENGKSASQLKLGRESIMFCDERRSRAVVVGAVILAGVCGAFVHSGGGYGSVGE